MPSRSRKNTLSRRKELLFLSARKFSFSSRRYECTRSYCFGSLPIELIVMEMVLHGDAREDLGVHHENGYSGLPSKVKADTVVAKNGSGKYRTVQEAVNHAPKINGSSRHVIYIKSGRYKENVVVGPQKRNLTFTGDGKGKTILSSNQSGGKLISSSGSLVVQGNGFLAIGITFENTAASDAPAVAMMCSSDRSAFFQCEFRGFQDTLYAKINRQFYKQCDIYGTIDFIFGDAAAVFQDCNIRVRKPRGNHTNVITAQGKSSRNTKTGTVLHHCNIIAAEYLGNVKTYLGRPWKQFSTTVVMQCSIDKLVDPSGWLEWFGHPEYKQTATYREFGNQGHGADTRRRVAWPGYKVIKARVEAEQYTVAAFIDGAQWLPLLGVPFTPGLK
ncbi:pectinesterase-like [Aristolochia californica]|uniref:pectinesterase-like n=1 Tax=Aristolochia californica TaxID=171875 RepID=UPI0035D567CE